MTFPFLMYGTMCSVICRSICSFYKNPYIYSYETMFIKSELSKIRGKMLMNVVDTVIWHIFSFSAFSEAYFTICSAFILRVFTFWIENIVNIIQFIIIHFIFLQLEDLLALIDKTPYIYYIRTITIIYNNKNYERRRGE